MPGSLLGNRVRRIEDPELLTGEGTFVGNLRIDGLLHAAFVRSPFAHAVIESIDVSEALALPGVVAVLTADDLRIGPFHPFMVLSEAVVRPPLATGRVRFVGDPVAVVVAESAAIAADGVDLVDVDYDPLPSVIDMEAALGPDSPLVFDEVPGNLVAGFREADPDAALAGADLVVRGRFVNQRLAVVPMEGDAIVAYDDPDDPDHDLTVHVGTQMPHTLWGKAAEVLDMDKGRLRVVTPHVGGAFGAKAGLAPEHAVVMDASRILGRPVAWVQTRSDNLLGMPHGRGQVQYGEMGFTRDGTITGLRCRMVGDAGAYGGFGGALVVGPTRMMAHGVYRIPTVAYDVAVALTNTTPMGAFRGAGRPEAAAFLERLVDIAADELDVDPVELRRRNLLRADELPLRTSTGASYDSGDYAAALDEALRLADYDGLRAEQQARRARGDRVVLGIGVSTYVEVTAGGGGSEYASVEVHHDGTATVKVGTSAHGQGHATSFAMMVSDQLGIPMESIRFVQSDTAAVPRGGGTGGSRSLQIGGSSVLRAAEGVLERAKAWRPTGSRPPSTTSWSPTTAASASPVSPRPASPGSAVAAAATDDGGPLVVEVDNPQSGPTFPFGAHVSVVEVDTDTGQVTPVRHVAVDDCGRILNPLIVQGQQHGGIAQGMAQALWEQFVYDDDGNPLTSTLAEYAMPSRRRARRRWRRPTPRRRRRSTRSAPRASASRARSAPCRPCRTPWSTPSATSACATSTCRARPSGCGRRSSPPKPVTPNRCGSRRQRSSSSSRSAARAGVQLLPTSTSDPPAAHDLLRRCVPRRRSCATLREANGSGGGR